MSVAALEADMSAEELGEWQAYFSMKHQVDELIHDGTDPTVARDVVWAERDEDA